MAHRWTTPVPTGWQWLLGLAELGPLVRGILMERINRIASAYRHLGERFPGRSSGMAHFCFQRYIPLGVAGKYASIIVLVASLGAVGACTRVSVSSSGIQGNGRSSAPDISIDGRFVVFRSAATNLVPGDTNDVPDIFVHDRATRRTIRVSVASDGTEGNAPADGNFTSEPPVISADGRFVAFTSQATNVVPDDTNDASDIFIHDRDADGDGIFDEPGAIATRRVSVSSNGTQANGTSTRPAMSADGRFVAFDSNAINMVPGDTNNRLDVFIHDRDLDGNGVFDELNSVATTRVSLTSDDTEANGHSFDPALSADGAIVAFESIATSLTPRDVNGPDTDVFLRDLVTGVTTLVSSSYLDSTETGDFGSVDPILSADGRFVAFSSAATEIVANDPNGEASDAFVFDRDTGINIRVSVPVEPPRGNVWVGGASAISADGRFVAFSAHLQVSYLAEPGDPIADDRSDVFVHDRDADGNGIFDDPEGTATTRVSVSADGAEGDLDSGESALSGDGRFVAFASAATNLVPGDTNNSQDVFVSEWQAVAHALAQFSIGADRQ